MPYRRPGSSRSSITATGGAIFQKGGANFEVRKHSLKRVIEIEPNKTAIIPLLHYHPTEPTGTTISAGSKISLMGSKRYANTAVQEGSTVRNIHLEIQIQPKTLSSSAICDFYTGRIMTSFHDIKGDQIYGMTPDTVEGKVKITDEASSPTATQVSGSTGIDNNPLPQNSMTKDSFDNGDVIKHWWKNIRKNVMYGGQPVLYDRWEKVPAKCTRSNSGMFYGLVIMNDASATTDDTDVLKVEIKESFTEIPLVQ